jgi:altronate dehydratase large subunit
MTMTTSNNGPSAGITAAETGMRGYLRPDGRKGIRNFVVVAYLVECAHHVARQIAQPFQTEGCQLIGFPGCYPSDYAHRVMDAMCTHPNVGAVVLVSLGCEEFRRSALAAAIAASGRPVELLVIQEQGGTRATVAEGRRLVEAWLAECLAPSAAAPTGFRVSPSIRPWAVPLTGWDRPAPP